MPSRVTKTLQRLAGSFARVLKGKTETKSSSPLPSRCGRNISALVSVSLPPKTRAAPASPKRPTSRVQRRALTQWLKEAGRKTEKHALNLQLESIEDISKLAERLSTLSIDDWVYRNVDMVDWFMKQRLGKRTGEPLESEPKRKHKADEMPLDSEQKSEQKILRMYDESRPLVRKALSPAAKIRASKQLSLPFPASIVPAFKPYQEVVPTAPVPQPQSQYNMAATSLGGNTSPILATYEQTTPPMEPATDFDADLNQSETALTGLDNDQMTTDQLTDPSNEPAISDLSEPVDSEEHEREEVAQRSLSNLPAYTNSTSNNAITMAASEEVDLPDYVDEEDEMTSQGFASDPSESIVSTSTTATPTTTEDHIVTKDGVISLSEFTSKMRSMEVLEDDLEEEPEPESLGISSEEEIQEAMNANSQQEREQTSRSAGQSMAAAPIFREIDDDDDDGEAMDGPPRLPLQELEDESDEMSALDMINEEKQLAERKQIVRRAEPIAIAVPTLPGVPESPEDEENEAMVSSQKPADHLNPIQGPSKQDSSSSQGPRKQPAHILAACGLTKPIGAVPRRQIQYKTEEEYDARMKSQSAALDEGLRDIKTKEELAKMEALMGRMGVSN